MKASLNLGGFWRAIFGSTVARQVTGAGKRQLSANGRNSNYYPDLLINNWLIVEVDGDCKYQTDTLPVLLQERARERELLRRGYGILRIRAADVDNHIVSEVTRYLDNAKRIQALAA